MDQLQEVKKKTDMKEITDKSYGIYPKQPTVPGGIWSSVWNRA